MRPELSARNGGCLGQCCVTGMACQSTARSLGVASRLQGRTSFQLVFWRKQTSWKLLIKRAYESLNEGGAFVAIENVIDDERKKHVFGMMMSLNMLIET
jgi:hypothetical protein